MISWETAKARGLTRFEWISQVNATTRPRAVQAERARPTRPETIECVHRGEQVDTKDCKTCGGNVKVKEFDCNLHDTTCTIAKKMGDSLVCQSCNDRSMVKRNIPFESFQNKFSGKAWVIGSGPTTFDYSQLADVTEPVFFINNAASMEKYVKHDETFFFALDRRQHKWFGLFRGTCVIPLGGPIATLKSDPILKNADRFCFWRNSAKYQQNLLQLTRDQIAFEHRLYRHGGTIHPLIHFAWYAGFDELNLVGCDGTIPKDQDERYDMRLENITGQKASSSYAKIRRAQDEELKTLGLKANYLCSPS